SKRGASRIRAYVLGSVLSIEQRSSFKLLLINFFAQSLFSSVALELNKTVIWRAFKYSIMRARSRFINGSPILSKTARCMSGNCFTMRRKFSHDRVCAFSYDIKVRGQVSQKRLQWLVISINITRGACAATSPRVFISINV